MLTTSSSTPLPEDMTEAVPAEGGAVVTLFDDLAVIPPSAPSRQVLMRRLADVVCLPESRINAFERSVTADLLVEMLRESDVTERARVAKRLSILAELPNSLVRLLLVDEAEVARPLRAAVVAPAKRRPRADRQPRLRVAADPRVARGPRAQAARPPPRVLAVQSLAATRG